MRIGRVFEHNSLTFKTSRAVADTALKSMSAYSRSDMLWQHAGKPIVHNRQNRIMHVRPKPLFFPVAVVIMNLIGEVVLSPYGEAAGNIMKLRGRERLDPSKCGLDGRSATAHHSRVQVVTWIAYYTKGVHQK